MCIIKDEKNIAMLFLFILELRFYPLKEGEKVEYIPDPGNRQL